MFLLMIEIFWRRKSRCQGKNKSVDSKVAAGNTAIGPIKPEIEGKRYHFANAFFGPGASAEKYDVPYSWTTSSERHMKKIYINFSQLQLKKAFSPFGEIPLLNELLHSILTNLRQLAK